MSVSLDLKHPQGLDVFRRLVAKSDVVVDNFRPGVMARLGIDHTSLAAIKPDIITCTITGFGETGPYKDRSAYDLVVHAFSGDLHITDEPDGPPSRVGIPLADIAGGLYACMGILGALIGKLLHGTGQHTREMLTQHLGLSHTDVDRLAGSNVVKDWSASQATEPEHQA